MFQKKAVASCLVTSEWKILEEEKRFLNDHTDWINSLRKHIFGPNAIDFCLDPLQPILNIVCAVLYG